MPLVLAMRSALAWEGDAWSAYATFASNALELLQAVGSPLEVVHCIRGGAPLSLSRASCPQIFTVAGLQTCMFCSHEQSACALTGTACMTGVHAPGRTDCMIAVVVVRQMLLGAEAEHTVDKPAL